MSNVHAIWEDHYPNPFMVSFYKCRCCQLQFKSKILQNLLFVRDPYTLNVGIVMKKYNNPLH